MNIAVHNNNKTCLWFMEELLLRSLEDLGYPVVAQSEADIIINIQCSEKGYHANRIDYPAQRHVLLQVEDWPGRTSQKEKPHSPWDFDKSWGFDIGNPHEEYFYLGYHPAMEVQLQDVPHEHDVGFLGGMSARRNKVLASVRNKFNWHGGWDYRGALQDAARHRIQVHFHQFGPTSFTPWDRYARFLYAGLFFISERCHCPLDVPMFDMDGYDDAVEYWLANPHLRKEKIKELVVQFKENFDMRPQLENKLKGVMQCVIKPV